MAAPLGFKTFATGDVLTAADTNGYLMQGVWTFADAAARDAAVTSPEEGNVCYLKSTDALMTYSGSAWTAVGSAGMTLLSTTSLSGASVTISSISQSYKNLIVYVYGMTNATADGNFQIKLNNAANGYLNRISDSTVAKLTSGTNWTTGINLNRTLNSNSFYYQISNYTQTATWKPVQGYGFYDATSGNSSQFWTGFEVTTSAISSLNLSNSGGNLSTGTCLIYGVN